MGAGPAHAVYFGTYETVKEATGGNREGHQFASTAFAGASATIAADAFMNPFDVIKQRMQMHGSQHRTVLQCASTVYKQEGSPRILRFLPNNIDHDGPVHSGAILGVRMG